MKARLLFRGFAFIQESLALLKHDGVALLKP
jgi:hypothetical protein